MIFDDGPAIPDNASIRRLWPLTTVLWPPEQGGKTTDGRPLVNLSIAVNYAISGLDVWSYHAFNLVVHMAAALALFGLVRRTLLLPRFRERFAKHATALALAIALIWGLHPLQTESVTYIIQRAESMAGLAYLTTLYCVARSEAGEQRRRWQIAAFLACLAGMATKEVVVTAPVVVFLYLWVFVFGSWRETLSQRWRFLAALASTWFLLAALVLALEGRGGSAGFESKQTVAEYAIMQLAVVVYYLKLCFSPRPLVLDYGARIVSDRNQLLTCGVIIFLMVAGTLWALRRQPWIGFLGSAFFLILSPSSSVVPVLTQTLAEHRMYLPLAPVVTLTVILCFLGLERLRRTLPAEASQGLAARFLPALVLAFAALLLGGQTWLRNLDYRTALSIWKDTVDKQPFNMRAHLNVARKYAEVGDLEAALRHAQRAIELAPQGETYVERGIVYLQMQDFERARADFDQAIELNARAWSAYFARGTLYFELQEWDKALADFNQTIELRPNFAKAYQNRGVVHRRLGRPTEAVADFDRALQLDAALTVSYRNRALALASLNRLSEARADVGRFLQLGGTADEELRVILDEE
jgi:tetratricopeptide (TPR) repeat protein